METKYFTELRFKKTNKAHDSGYSCIEIIGYNCFTKEETVLAKYSDVIHLPYISFDEKHYDTNYSKRFGALSIDVKPNEDYFRLFVVSNKHRIAITGFIGSDFLFNVVEIEENA